MPKKIDPITGEEKEVSMEEFMEIMRKGGNNLGGIQQIVKDAAGNEIVTDIYGNVSGIKDGLDRSLNVFICSSDLSLLIQKAMDSLIKHEPDPEDPEAAKYKGYVMTVDYLDKAITWVMTVTEEEVTLGLYDRDDRKSNTDLISMHSWKKENGALLINNEEIEKDKYIIYSITFSYLKKQLLKKGILTKLREFNNKGTGVIVSVVNGIVDAKIVKGKDRPDLPCETAFLGEQMCRPYPDEWLSE